MELQQLNQALNGITSIEDYTFDYCEFTGELVIPNSVKTIGKRAFIECKNFTGDLVIPNSVETIGESAFENCTGFEGSLTIGENVKNIENNAFKGCVGLKGDLVIPDNVKSIGMFAFENCSGLKEIYLGKNYYGSSKENAESGLYSYGLFDNAFSLSKIIVSDYNEHFANDENGVLYSKNQAVFYQQ